jgi:hypothetical protein
VTNAGVFNPTTLAILVLALVAIVVARLMFGSGFNARLTWLSDFLGFGTVMLRPRS